MKTPLFRRMLLGLLALLTLVAQAEAANSWLPISTTAPWRVIQRFDMSLDCVEYHNQLWLVGEALTATMPPKRHDLWRTSDGVQWTKVNALLPWTYVCHLVVFKDKLWAVSVNGNSGGIWNSSDGVTWTLVVAKSPLAFGRKNSAIVFNNKLWLIDTGSTQPGVWSSADGIAWTRELASNPFPEELWGYGTVVFNNKLWLLGGTTANAPIASAVWSSADGKTWTKVTGAAAWSPRYDHGTVVWNNKMWVISGCPIQGDGSAAKDVWSSADGVHWTQETVAAPWQSGFAATVTTYKSVIWRMASTSSEGVNISDTWTLGLPAGTPALQPYKAQTIVDGFRFTSPVPALRQGTSPLTWTLISGPSGMTVNAQTGVVTWPMPLARTQPYVIRERVSNMLGSSDLVWNLTVSPQPATRAWVPAFTREAMVPVTWNAIPSVSGYTIQSDDAPDFATPLTTINVSASTMRQLMTAPPGGNTYWYRVRGNKIAPLTSVWSKPTSCTRDLIAPTGTIRVAQTPPPVANAIMLNLAVTDPGSRAAGPYAMRFSVDGVAWTPWEPYQTFKALQVDRGGALAVRAQVVDRVWNLLTLQTVATAPAPAANTLFVDARNTNAPWSGTFAHPYRKIQQALDAACNGAMIIAAPGTYLENINFKGKNLVLRSSAPQAQSVVKTTIIDGQSSGSVVRFAGTESAACRIEGFTLSHGLNEYGGGINGNGTNATIQYNRITDNIAYAGSGHLPDPNSPGGYAYFYFTGFGGGLANCKGVIQNNIIAFNAANEPQTYATSAKPLALRSIERGIVLDYHYDITLQGGALFNCPGTIQNNTFYSNETGGSASYWARQGGSQYSWAPSIMGAGVLRNNIIWTSDLDPELASRTSYCCISGWTSGGLKNITSAPGLVDPIHDDFRLQATSPCIDAGARTSATRDIDGEARGYNGSVLPRGDGSDFDIGADEYIPATPAR